MSKIMNIPTETLDWAREPWVHTRVCWASSYTGESAYEKKGGKAHGIYLFLRMVINQPALGNLVRHVFANPSSYDIFLVSSSDLPGLVAAAASRGLSLEIQQAIA